MVELGDCWQGGRLASTGSVYTHRPTDGPPYIVYSKQQADPLLLLLLLLRPAACNAHTQQPNFPNIVMLCYAAQE